MISVVFSVSVAGMAVPFGARLKAPPSAFTKSAATLHGPLYVAASFRPLYAGTLLN